MDLCLIYFLSIKNEIFVSFRTDLSPFFSPSFRKGRGNGGGWKGTVKGTVGVTAGREGTVKGTVGVKWEGERERWNNKGLVRSLVKKEVAEPENGAEKGTDQEWGQA